MGQSWCGLFKLVLFIFELLANDLLLMSYDSVIFMLNDLTKQNFSRLKQRGNKINFDFTLKACVGKYCFINQESFQKLNRDSQEYQESLAQV